MKVPPRLARSLLVFLGACLFTFALAQDPVKIGFVSPFSGPVGFLGQWFGNSIQAEVDRINAEGGLLGRQLELITRDDELNPAKSVEAVRELISREGVSLIIGPSFSSNALAAKPVIEGSGVIGMFPSAGSMELLADEPTYLFRAQESTDLTARELLRLASERGLSKVSIFAPDDAFGQDYDARFTELAGEYGIEYLGAEFFREDDQDLTPYAQRLKSSGAENVVIPTGNSALGAKAVVALDAVGFEPLVTGISGLQGYNFTELAGDPAEGVTFVSTYLGYPAEVPFDEMPPEYAAHVQRVIDTYGTVEGASLNTYPGSALGGLAVFLWEQAVEQAGTFEADAVAAVLETLSYTAEETPVGVPITVDPETHETYGEGSLSFYEWYKKDDGTSFGFREVE